MVTETTLDMPLSEAELDELESFLMSPHVPEDCMGLEMLDGFLTACACAPTPITPSQWLPVVWGNSPGETQAQIAFSSKQQAQRIMELILRHWATIGDLLRDMPTMYKPILYTFEGSFEEEIPEGMPYEGHEWCLGFMTGVLMCEDQWRPLMEHHEAADWLFPIQVLAFGNQEPEYGEWIDDPERRGALVDEIAIAAVLIYRFFSEQRQEQQANNARGQRRSVKSISQKKYGRLH
jgi:uncharacterized protein